MSNQIETRVKPGDIVPGGFTYENNATVSGDFLYLRDENGNQIAGRTVSDGDRITVLKIISDKKLALIQYPTASGVREGYVSNSINVIKYDNLEKWVNGSTVELVYETEVSTNSIGSLSPGERATILYKKGNRYNLVYDTSLGVRSKSGFVDYDGGIGTNSGVNGVRPGELVPGGFSYPNNAVIENDFLYLRDENGNQIAGRTVSVGDKITVLDISYSKQLALIQYPTSSGVRQGYVTNTTNIIRYLDEYNWYNGSTAETVYLNSIGNQVFGTLNPFESATKLYEKDGRIHVVYDTDKGMLTKSGYVNFKGLAIPPLGNVTIPSISASGVEKIQYGTSGKGRPLNAYKIGNGSKILFAGFALHGFEDNWRHDGEALVKIATELVYKFSNYNGANGLHGWTVYIAQCMNPDGVVEGRTNNGPGRCAVTTRIDMNRCFPYNFVVRTNSREYTGSYPLGAPEALALKNFVQSLNGQATEMVVLDFHGWLTFSQGNAEIGRYFGNQFGFGHNNVYSAGFFSSWASTLKNTKATLIEYPASTRSYQDVINGNYIGKTFNAIINILKDNPGSGSTGGSGSTSGEESYNAQGKIKSGTVSVNIRSGAGTSFSILGTLKGNDSITIISRVKPSGESLYWYKINFGSGIGYVRSDFVDIISTDGSGSNGGNNGGDYDNNSEYHRILMVTNPLMKGADIKRVQNKLNDLGFSAGTADGIYGYGTESAVIRFQKVKGLSVDGRVGQNTWDKLMNSIGGGVSGEYDNNAQYHRVLRVTTPLMRGEDVKQVQNRLNNLGYYVGTVDGAYGYGTEAEVIKFQKSQGLSADGEVGQNTWDKLIGQNNNNNNSPVLPLDLISVLTDLYEKTFELYPNGNNQFRNRCVLDYLRHLEYGESGALGIVWNELISPDRAFYNLVNSDTVLKGKASKFLSNLNVFNLNGSQITIPHLAATTLGYMKTNLGVPEFLTGWGGDLATVIGQVIKASKLYDKNSPDIYSKLYKYAYDLIGGPKGISTFGLNNFYEDIDAIYFAQNIGLYPISTLFINYYESQFIARQSIITNSIKLPGKSLADSIYSRFVDEGLQGNLIGSGGLMIFIFKEAGKELFMQIFNSDPNFIMNIYKVASYAFANRILSLRNGYL